ncbi:hypothetical protein P152DRAFT_386778 [Eremomyces bilateralis CBS 781.70]|uniref:F-box domain-containing protein n=1 Tax=Eremomyces bilateralis CBS 781.70 TaxID=1392243 RepID=A0A6G1GH98_9PEZI|nr:uncharacterized protein P152DRAFT_386778 [Eremomyces bilateralis CBS 781.70]KAF1817448.1 hypothetical protein P152DRAFT_386778 [Eremomyces bilateralis CBS 781.70]
MQSESTEIFQKASSNSSHVESSNTSTQHGSPDSSIPAPPGFPREPRDGDGQHSRPELPSVGGRIAVDGTQTETRPVVDSFSSTLTETASPGRHIVTYENALVLSGDERWEGPDFQVISNGSASAQGSLTDSLPNEILIHAFSHLSAPDLNTCALVCQRFHSLLNSPYVWKAAFIRYFPGNLPKDRRKSDSGIDGVAPVFTRLSNRSTWRKEYILRTQLLRAIARGKPLSVEANTRDRTNQSPIPSTRQYQNPLVTYDSELLFNIDRIDGTFGTGLDMGRCKFIHGQSLTGLSSRSDPASRKLDGWGNRWAVSAQFSQLHSGEAEYGLGSGSMVGCPNVMDISQHYGVIHGVGSPRGFTEFYSTHNREVRRISSEMPIVGVLDEGVPQVEDLGANCAVWITKSRNIPFLSNGLAGMLVGSASGIVSMYTVGGPDATREARLQRGDLTARWVLSPGVPIIAFAVDEEYSLRRLNQNRVWAVALNALGEVFYLSKFPVSPDAASWRDANEVRREALAWKVGRSIYWNLVEASRRRARPDPYHDAETDGSYTPRSSWIGMCLDGQQLAAETREIESFLRLKPMEFRNRCVGWEMRRKMEVDFAGDDGRMAGESVVVFMNPETDGLPDITRYCRTRILVGSLDMEKTVVPHSAMDQETQNGDHRSVFGNRVVSKSKSPAPGEDPMPDGILSSNVASNQCSEEWRLSKLTFGLLRNVSITVTALDMSNPALTTASEDMSVSRDDNSDPPSSSGSSISERTAFDNGINVPGKNSRFVGVGTTNGVVFLWNIRASPSPSMELVNNIEPVCVIRTESPSITSLAMTALCVVHGGEDGVVQIWDPLGSSTSAVRTLNSRFTARYHRQRYRRLTFPIPDQFSNSTGATAILLDPNPTVLRGIVALGTDLRFWSFSSDIANDHKRSKRRLRRGDRGINDHGDRFAPSARGSSFQKYLAHEVRELEREREERRKERERLSGRFGVGLLDNEEEALAYAAMLSEQSLQEDIDRRESESSAYASDSSVPVSQTAGASSPSWVVEGDDEFEAQMEEAMRLSQETDQSISESIDQASSSRPQAYDIPIRYAKSRSPSRRHADIGRSPSLEADIEFAKQLSLAEEESRREADLREDEEEDFPALDPRGGKGKLRA